jgi:hypothetical protein
MPLGVQKLASDTAPASMLRRSLPGNRFFIDNSDTATRPPRYEKSPAGAYNSVTFGSGITDREADMSPLKLSIEEIKSARIVGYKMQIVATAYGEHDDRPVFITPECVTLSQLEREITRMQDDLVNILEQARSKFNYQSQNNLI